MAGVALLRALRSGRILRHRNLITFPLLGDRGNDVPCRLCFGGTERRHRGLPRASPSTFAKDSTPGPRTAACRTIGAAFSCGSMSASMRRHTMSFVPSTPNREFHRHGRANERAPSRAERVDRYKPI